MHMTGRQGTRESIWSAFGGILDPPADLELAANIILARENADLQARDHHLDGLTLFLHTRTTYDIYANSRQ